MKLNIRRAEPGEGRRTAELVKAVFAVMPKDQKIWFSIDAIDLEAKRIDSGEDMAFLAEDGDEGNRLAGVFIVEFPGDRGDNMGHYAGLSGEQLQQVAHMDTAAVLPDYRGQKLQRRNCGSRDTGISCARCIRKIPTAGKTSFPSDTKRSGRG